jgi:anti-sigma B factor antagonist
MVCHHTISESCNENAFTDISSAVNVVLIVTADDAPMNTGQLQIERRTLGEITILDCTGRIVVRREAEFFFDTVAFAIERSRSVLLNLDGVSAIDSGGLGALVLLQRFAETFSCDLNLCSAKPHIAEVISLTGLHQVLDLHRSEDDAIKSYFRNIERAVELIEAHAAAFEPAVSRSVPAAWDSASAAKLARS